MQAPLSHLRLALAALGAGACGFLASTLLVPPKNYPVMWGKMYSKMSEDPFGLVGRVPHRILSPLLGHVLGLTGDRFYLFSLGVLVLLLSLVFVFCRMRGTSYLDAFLVTLAIAVTAPVLNAVLWTGYTDSLTYVLLLAAVMSVRHRWLCFTLFGLCLFNHEQALAVLPWLVFLRWSNGGRLKLEVGFAAIALVPYFCFRLLIDGASDEATLDFGYYLNYFAESWRAADRAQVLVPGFFMTFGFFWTLAFWHARSSRVEAREKHGLLLYLGCVTTLLLFAHDTNRVFSLFLIGMVLIAIRFLAQPGARVPFLLILFFTSLIPYRPFVGIWPEPAQRILIWNLVAAALLGLCFSAGVWLAHSKEMSREEQVRGGGL